jgi:hypothetical protein
MPRITANEARAMGETSVVQLVEQAYDRIRARAPYGTQARLSRADDPVWATFPKGSREKLEEVASILRSDGFQVTYYWSNLSTAEEAETVIDWRSPE